MSPTCPHCGEFLTPESCQKAHAAKPQPYSWPAGALKIGARVRLQSTPPSQTSLLGEMGTVVEIDGLGNVNVLFANGSRHTFYPWRLEPAPDLHDYIAALGNMLGILQGLREKVKPWPPIHTEIKNPPALPTKPREATFHCGIPCCPICEPPRPAPLYSVRQPVHKGQTLGYVRAARWEPEAGWHYRVEIPDPKMVNGHCPITPWWAEGEIQPVKVTP